MSPISSVQTLVMTKLQIVPFGYHSETGSYGFKHTTHCFSEVRLLVEFRSERDSAVFKEGTLIIVPW